VVVVSADRNPLSSSAQEGVLAVLCKPFSLEELYALLDEHC
jgi:hypothetical protein